MPRLPSSLVLGSRSPQRLLLLKQLFPKANVEVVPPLSAEETGFAGLHDWNTIQSRLQQITCDKSDDVIAQLMQRNDIVARQATVICADTTIIGIQESAALQVLGKPPEDATWKETVRGWFQQFYFGKTHFAATAVCIDTPEGERYECTTRTEIRFDSATERWLEWYLETEESRGKAGGYAIQGAGSIFLSEFNGSLSNIIGLPQRELLQLLQSIT